MAKQETATKKKTETKTKKSASQESKKNNFQGEFILAVGRRKTSVSQVRLYQGGEGVIKVNNKDLEEYFDEDRATTVLQPLKLTGHLKDLNFSVLAKGGGPQGQAEATKLGIARALIKFDEELLSSLKAKGWITRDDRRKERKKPGLKKARKSPQWSKR